VIVGHHDLHARRRHLQIIPHAGRLVDGGDGAHPGSIDVMVGPGAVTIKLCGGLAAR
jgi:hypothetical protein